MDSSQYPQLGEMVRNFAQTANKIIRDPRRVSPQEYQDRMTTCFDCPSFDVNKLRCKKCGCFMKAKATFKAARCPLKKWKVD